MNYAVRKRLIGRLLTTATFALVIVNLLPIFWMIYSSLKDNNEILTGKVGISRRPVQIEMLRPLQDGTVMAASRDGGLGLFRETDGVLKRIRSVNRGWFAASFNFDRDGTLWAVSADRGLMRLSPGWKVERRWDLAAWQKAWRAQFPGRPWNTVWVNDVFASSVVAKAGRVFAALRMDHGPGVAVCDTASGSLRFLNMPAGLPFSVDEVRDVPSSPLVLLIGANGIVGWNAATSRAVSRWEWGEALPWDRPQEIRALDADRLLLVQSAGAEIFSLTQGRVIQHWAWTGLNSRAQCAVADGAGLWLGSSGGIARMVIPQGDADSSAVPLLAGRTQFDAVAVTKAGSHIYAGSSDGRVMDFTAEHLDSLATGQLARGHFYVHWRNYVDLWRNLPFGTYLLNSLLVCTSVMLIAMVLASLAGYALARFRFPGKDFFGMSVLATQMIPGIMFLVPLYVLFTKVSQSTGIRIVGSYWGLIALYSAFYVPFTIWILRSFFAAIPKELEEAALVDGCGPLRAFWSVILPAAMPGILATGIYVFLTAWDELMFAWVLTSESTYTIPVGIRLFAGNYQNRYDLMMAAATVATLPVMILFFLMQKQIVSGLTAGAVKG